MMNTTDKNGLTLLWQYMCTECVLKTEENTNWKLVLLWMLCTAGSTQLSWPAGCSPLHEKETTPSTMDYAGPKQ